MMYVPGVLTSTTPDEVTATLPAQVSLAVAPGLEKLLCHSTVNGLDPFRVIVGAVVSTISMITSSSSEPPPEDATVSVMLCEPGGNETVSIAPVPSVVAPSFQVQVSVPGPVEPVPSRVTAVNEPPHSTVWSVPALAATTAAEESFCTRSFPVSAT